MFYEYSGGIVNIKNYNFLTKIQFIICWHVSRHNYHLSL